MLKAQGRRDDVRQVGGADKAPAETSVAPRAWVRPAVVERSACAEIGAYAGQG